MVDTSFLNLTTIILALLSVVFSVVDYFVAPVGEILADPYSNFLRIMLGNVLDVFG
jgi:uncharacterized protein involved in cysteine biosynthesis